MFQPCNLGGKAPLMSISGTYNSDTLYIYKDG
nr:MAG TPA: Copper resistance protein K [Caudoviricetes sp.]